MTTAKWNRLALLAMIGAGSLALSACGDKGGEANQAAGAAAGPVAAVAPPKGTSWSETIAMTPAGGVLMGNPDAKLKLLEFGSLTCPHCKEFAETSDAGIRAAVDTGKVSFEFRNFVRDPLDITASLLSRCGGKDPYFPLTHQLFGYQAKMFETLQAGGEAGYQAAMKLPAEQRFVKLGELTGLIEFVKARGIAEPQARACLADFKEAEKLAGMNEAGVKEFQIEGTPTIVLNGRKLENANTWPQLQAALKDAGA